MKNLSDLRQQYPDSWLLEYIDECRSGEIIVGREIFQEFDILLGNFGEESVRFELEDAHKRIKFIETHCKHYEAPFAGKPFILTLRQKAFVEALYSFKIFDDEIGRWVRLYQEALLLVGRKCGKALALDTPIPTPTGWAKMEDISPGDIVFNEHGEPTPVVATSDVFIGHKCYEVRFEDGETITADAEHLWAVMTKHSRRCCEYTPTSTRKLPRADCRENGGYINLTTEQMARDFVRTRPDGKGVEYKYRVPVAMPIAYGEKELPIDPYLLGIWIGDGESGGARISVSRNEVDDFINRITENNGRIISVKNDKSCVRVRISQESTCLNTQLGAMGLIGNKHIPTLYLQASILQRRKLLQGLMDTDGTCATNGECEFVQKSKLVIDGFSELLSSLGIKHTTHSKIPTCNGKKCDLVYRVTFFVDQMNSCFQMKRKHNRLKPKLSPRMLNKSITGIQEVPSTPTKCIRVASPRGLFLAGKKMTVTHNTPFVAALMLAEWFCGELGTKELCSSNDYDQAALMLDAINAMREESPTLEKVTRKNVKGIFFGNPKKPKKRGKFSYQNKGNIKKISAKTGAKEGKNIKVGASDEIHEMKDNSSIMPIRQALSTQDEPLYFEITTEGFTDSGYLDDRLKDARQVLKGELERPRWLIFLYTQDSEAEIWQDEKSWAKSNPDIGTIKKWSFLRQMVEEAKTNSATRAFVLAKDFNIKQAGGAAWLQDAEIINPATFNIEDFRGGFYIAGNDFAETTDLCASKLLLMKPGDPMIYFWSHYWIPEEKLKNSPDDADYKQWKRDGYMTIVPGGSVDSSLVADWQWSLYQDFGLIPYKSGYDNRFAKDYIRKYEEYFGNDSEAVNVPQDAKCLNNPMRRLESDMRHKLVNYNNRYGDFWCFRNTGVKPDNAERIQPCKLKSTHRIDGAAAAIDCYAVLEWYKSEFLTLVGSR